jgi:hypothetical protein
MNIPEKTLQNMLASITDPKMRELYGNILGGNVTHQVECLSSTCKGRIVGYIFAPSMNGQVVVSDNLLMDEKTATPVLDEQTGLPVSGIKSSRERLDGQRGFSCWCGNTSILAQEEKGVISANMPTMDDLQKIAGRLQAKGGQSRPVINDIIEVDGFKIVKVKV